MYELNIDKQKLNIKKILESGQIFRYEIIQDEYILITGENYVVCKETLNGYKFYCEKSEFKNIWYKYLQLDRDYDFLNKKIISKDERLKSVIEKFQGIRILKQDEFEMLISFIVSQSKSIPQIRKLLNELSEKYGKTLGEYKGKKIYAMPKAEDLKDVTEQDYKLMKFGYRARYLEDAVKKTLSSDVLALKNNYSKEEVKAFLIEIKGVGNKVAACTMLFGFGIYDVFPIDVWMRRVMINMYFEGEKQNDKKLEKYGIELFGEVAGIAQQYLFEYGRKYL